MHRTDPHDPDCPHHLTSSRQPVAPLDSQTLEQRTGCLRLRGSTTEDAPPIAAPIAAPPRRRAAASAPAADAARRRKAA